MNDPMVPAPASVLRAVVRLSVALFVLAIAVLALAVAVIIVGAAK
jgi:hypothetical protein